MLVFSLQVVLVFGVSAQNPNLPPSGNFDLSDWKVTLPDQTEKDEEALSGGFESTNEFYTDPITGAMVFKCRNDGETGGSTYPRSELREMLRAGNSSINTKGIGLNNWVFSSSSQSNKQASGGVDGVLSATVTVDHVSTTGESGKVGRVIIGQIHASDDEPCRLYYRKLPGNTKGSIYFAHEPADGFGSEQWHEMIGSRSSSASNPADGIELGEKFSYEIKVDGNNLTVTIMRAGKPDVVKLVDMSTSGFANDYMYFKAGVYNQNNTGDAGDHCQVSFYALSNSHSSANNNAPYSSITSPSNDATLSAGSNITITAEASDDDGSIAKVEFFQGTTKLGEDTSAPFSHLWGNVAEGNYVLTAIATDNENGTFTSLGINISVSSETIQYNVPYDIPKFQTFLAECKLQSPLSATLATDSEIIAGYSSDVFEVVDGDKIAFNQTRNSEETSLRTELRFLENWYVSDGDRSLRARIKIVEQTCDQVTVMQIHNDTNEGGGPSSPLLRIYKHQTKSPINHLWAAIKTDDTGEITTHVDLGEAPSGYFDVEIRVVDSNLFIDVDEATKVDMDISFWTFPSYWKAGVYLQDEGEATAHFDQLFTGNGSGMNVSPSVEITSPSNGTFFDAGDDITVSATAFDTDGSVSKVEFFRGNTKLGDDVSAPYAYTWSNVSADDYVLTARATDNHGASTTSTGIDITVNAATTQYTLNVSTTGNGSVIANPSGGTYDHGTVVSLSATPDSGNQFAEWGQDGGGTSNTMTILMNSNKSVTAKFSSLVLGVENPKLNTSRNVENHPNPFNFKTTIEYELFDNGQVELSIYNVSGKKIKTLINEFQGAGNQQMDWIPAGDLPNGLYFARIKSDSHTQTIRMALVR